MNEEKEMSINKFQEKILEMRLVLPNVTPIISNSSQLGVISTFLTLF